MSGPSDLPDGGLHRAVSLLAPGLPERLAGADEVSLRKAAAAAAWTAVHVTDLSAPPIERTLEALGGDRLEALDRVELAAFASSLDEAAWDLQEVFESNGTPAAKEEYLRATRRAAAAAAALAQGP